MKTLSIGFVCAGFVLFLTGCVTVSQYKFSFDFNTGEIMREYYDLSSRQGGGEKDYSVTNDWAALKRLVADQESEFDADVVEDVSKGLFETNKVLCGRKIQKVKSPKSFPSKAAVLSYVHDKEWRFELINEEIVLVLPSGKKIVSTNGQAVTTPKNSLIFWPQTATRFDYVVSEPWSGGTSFLSYFREEQGAKK